MTDVVTPHATAAEWLADAVGAADAVAQGLTWQSGGWIVGVLAALGAVAKLGPLLGPWGAAASQAVQAVARLMLPKEAQEAQRRLGIAEDTLWRIVAQIEQLPPAHSLVKDLKAQISMAAPSEFQTMFARWKAERQALEPRP